MTQVDFGRDFEVMGFEGVPCGANGVLEVHHFAAAASLRRPTASRLPLAHELFGQKRNDASCASSNKGVLAVCAPLFLGCMFAWTLTGLRWVEPVAVYALFGIHILMGISTAGMALASGNVAMLRIARAPFSLVRTAASRERPEKGC